MACAVQDTLNDYEHRNKEVHHVGKSDDFGYVPRRGVLVELCFPRCYNVPRMAEHMNTNPPRRKRRTESDRPNTACLSRAARGGKFALFCFLFAVLFILLARPYAQGPDWRQYYCHLASLVLDGDLAYENQIPLLLKERVFLSSRGHILNNYSVGPALFWIPFFIMGHVEALLAWIGRPFFIANGDSHIHVFWVNASSWVYGVLALLLAYGSAREFASDRAATLACVGICFGTPFFYYATFFSPSSHNTSVLLTASMVYLWLQMERRRALHSRAAWAMLGLVAGLAVCQRIQNAAYLVLPAASFIQAVGAAWRQRQGAIAAVGNGVAFAACFVLGYLPQMMVSDYMTGNWSGVNLLHLRLRSQTHLNVVPLFFSSFNGAYFWSPILLCASIGFVFLWLRAKKIGALLVAVFLLNVYAVAGHLAWWGGDSFGSRFLLNCTPIFAICLACFLDNLSNKVAVPLVVVCVGWTYLLFLHSMGGGGAIYKSPSVILNEQLATLVAFPSAVWDHIASAWRVTRGEPLAVWFATRIAGAAVALVLVRLGHLCLTSPSRTCLQRLLVFGMVAVCGFNLWIVRAMSRDRPVTEDTARQLVRSDGDLFSLSCVLFERGVFMFCRGRDEEAAKSLREALSAWPGFPNADLARRMLRMIESENTSRHGHTQPSRK